jgi:hypothetical protein
MQVHPNIVRVRNIFISNEWDSMNALTFAHDFIFGAMTLQVYLDTYIHDFIVGAIRCSYIHTFV